MRIKCEVLRASSALLAITLAAAAVGQEEDFTLLEREIAYLQTIAPGEYDNWQQTNIERVWEKSGAGAGAGARLYATVESVDPSSLDGSAGVLALGIEVSRPGDAQAAHQRGAYLLSADEEKGVIEARAYVAPAAANEAAPLERRENCDLAIRRDLFSFVGESDRSDCTELPRSLRVTADRLDIRTSGSDERWRRLRKAQRFVCMIDVPKDDPATANHTQHYVDLHDQGGSFDFVHPDGRNMQLLLGYDWSYGMQRDTLFVGVLDLDDNSRTLVYGWGEPGADRIGVNPGWIRVQCDLDSPENRQMQERLRPDS